ncbi:hypothetical protein Sjap_009307 [Stephania japonica]|uniref:Uncharacterized protein n=1 Tax=Stephania japonica TaxID=461633 RepID=A0AAP0PBL8_9MAGN
MDGRSTIPSRDETSSALLLGVRKLRVSLEDRLTTPEVRMTKYSNITGPGRRNFEMAASLTTEPSERQRLYPRLYEGNDRQGFASTKRQAGQSFGASTHRGTPKLETRETGCDDETGINRVDRIGIQGSREEMRGMWCCPAMVGLCGCVVGLRRPPRGSRANPVEVFSRAVPGGKPEV